MLDELPAEIPHPRVLAAGSAEDMSWSLTDRCDGGPLVQLLHGLPAQDVDRLMVKTREIARALHAWHPSDELRARLERRPALDPADPSTVCAADLVPLPVRRTLESIVPLAKQVVGVDPDLVDEAARRVRSLAAHDPFMAADEQDRVVVHGDATAANVLVHAGRITALIDFEHVRMAPPDLELLSPVPYGSGFGLAQRRRSHRALFAREDLCDRVRLAELCAALRGLIWWPPPPGDDGTGEPHPPVGVLRRLVDAPTPW